MLEATAGEFMEPEAQTLAERYRPRSKLDGFVSTEDADLCTINGIKERYQQYEGLNLGFSALQE